MREATSQPRDDKQVVERAQFARQSTMDGLGGLSVVDTRCFSNAGGQESGLASVTVHSALHAPDLPQLGGPVTSSTAVGAEPSSL